MPYRYHLALATALLASSGAACSRTEATDAPAAVSSNVVEVEVVAVERSQIHSSLELVGTLFPWKFATISSEVEGIIKSIPDSGRRIEYEIDGEPHAKVLSLDIGFPVKRGDVLVEIDPTESQLALESAQARLELAQKELANLKAWKRPEEVEQLRAQFEEASAVLEDAQAELDRVESLQPDNIVSQSQYDQSKRVFHVARALKKRAEAALRIAEAGPTVEELAVVEARVAAAKAEVAVQADKLAKCTIRCPLDNAVIVERFLGVGDRVTATPKTDLMRVIDPTILLAEVGVPEKHQGRIRPQDPATVRAEGVTGGRPGESGVPAMVVLVNEQIDPATRTFRVRVGIDNSKGLFKAGTFVKVGLPVDSASNVLVVPAEALTFADGDPAVFVCHEGRVEKRSVRLGIANRTHYEILSGLSETEQVVVGNTSLLADGLEVRPKTAEPLASAASQVSQ